MTGRARLKRALETGLIMSGAARVGRGLRRHRALVLAYHNILPDGELAAGDRSLHLPLANFRRQLDLLQDLCEIVPLLEAFEPPSPGIRRPRVALTFDDAYHGAVVVGLPEVARRGLPATMFVAPGCLGNEGFWWDRLQPAPGLPLSDSLRDEALTRCRGVESEVRGLGGGSWARVPPSLWAATEAELTAAAAAVTLSLAPHTWSHPNLAALSEAELAVELTVPLSWLRARFPRVLACLAYPYGLSSPVVERAAAAAGYTSGLRVHGGWLPAAGAHPFRLPRLNVSAGLSAEGFQLRLAGLLA